MFGHKVFFIAVLVLLMNLSSALGASRLFQCDLAARGNGGSDSHYPSCTQYGKSVNGNAVPLPHAWYGNNIRTNCDTVRFEVYSEGKNQAVRIVPLRKGLTVGRSVIVRRLVLARDASGVSVSYSPFDASEAKTDPFLLKVEKNGHGWISWMWGRSRNSGYGPFPLKCTK